MKNLTLTGIRVWNEIKVQNTLDLRLSIAGAISRKPAEKIVVHNTGLSIARGELCSFFIEEVIKNSFDKLYEDHKIIPEVGDVFEFPLDFIDKDGDSEIVWIGVKIQDIKYYFEDHCYCRLYVEVSLHN